VATAQMSKEVQGQNGPRCASSLGGISHVLKALVLCLTPVVISACRESDRASETVTFRDSAGVTIAENAGPSWVSGRAWRVDTVPELVIGVLDGAPEYVLDGIGGATRLSDGTIALGQQHEIRYFDKEGHHIRTVGRRGQAEGEFGAARLVRLAGDSLGVVDITNQRFTVLDEFGRLVSTVRLPQPMTVLSVRGVFADRSLIGTAPRYRFPTAAQSGAEWDSITVLRFHLGATEYDTVAVLPYFSRSHHQDFALNAVLVPTQRGYWYGVGERYELMFHEPDGTVTRILRAPYPAVEISEEVRARHQEVQRELAASGRWTAEGDLPDFQPAYRFAVSDVDNNLWVWSPLSYEEGLPPWVVFDEDGRLLGQVAPPNRSVPFEIGSDYFLTSDWDEYGVEYLHLYRIVKP